ncbi:MAG TPA: HU family DNA-binding protein [Firmicutes bacterium]|nr:HU family DNA-binding protein [Candidatus Fermentithermobacillaceae bacterium]
MNKTELIAKVAEQAGMTKKDTEKIVNTLIDVVQDTLAKGEPVAILGFGTFLSRERPARDGRNPRTGEAIQIPAARVPVFRPGRGLKGSVGGDVEK